MYLYPKFYVLIISNWTVKYDILAIGQWDVSGLCSPTKWSYLMNRAIVSSVFEKLKCVRFKELNTYICSFILDSSIKYGYL